MIAECVQRSVRLEFCVAPQFRGLAGLRCTAPGTTYKGISFRVCAAPQLRGTTVDLNVEVEITPKDDKWPDASFNINAEVEKHTQKNKTVSQKHNLTSTLKLGF